MNVDFMTMLNRYWSWIGWNVNKYTIYLKAQKIPFWGRKNDIQSYENPGLSKQISIVWLLLTLNGKFVCDCDQERSFDGKIKIDRNLALKYSNQTTISTNSGQIKILFFYKIRWLQSLCEINYLSRSKY